MLRIAAAIAVILGHSFPLTGHREPLSIGLDAYAPTLAGDAVAIFFVISGFLITMSWTSSPKAVPYSVKRFARIWPAFAVVVVAAALVLGPLVTTLTAREYYLNRATWSYIGQNLIMHIEHFLPGVFTNQPNGSVNGSLWTLPYEVVAYVGVLLLGLVGLMQKRVAVLALLVAVVSLHRFGAVSHEINIAYSAGGVALPRLLWLGMWFLAGSTLYLFRDRVPWRPAAASLALLLIALSVMTGEGLPFFAGFAYLVIYVGTRQWRVEKVRRLGDPSYGIYLYAFPVQQTLVLGGMREAWSLFLAATPIAIAFGYASWHLIERPGMRSLRRKFTRPSLNQRAGTPTDASAPQGE